jgi:hypothetical protein
MVSADVDDIAAARPAVAVARALAGPALIVGSVLAALHDFAFGGLVSRRNLDLVAYFFPNHCFLGRSLAAGHIPAWNPYAMGGVPFAADPQSGWGYLPATTLYSVLPCDVALRSFEILLPVLGGLGVYWFLRSEKASRAAATCGGVVLALAMINSRMIVSAPFAGAVAWTALLLAASSRYFRSRTLPGNLAWVVVAAGAWGQLAAAHMSHGLILGTLALAVYIPARFWIDAREGAFSPRRAVTLVALLIAAIPLVNLFLLLPRLAYLPQTSISLGYRRLEELARLLAGDPPRPLPIGSTRGFAWPLRLGLPPGDYLGSGVLLLALGSFWSRRYRALAVAVGAFGVAMYLATVNSVAQAVAPVARQTALGTFYLHGPARFRHGVLLAAAILIGLGLHAWQEDRSTRSRIVMVGASLALWGLLPFALGYRPDSPILFILGGALAGAGLVLGLHRRAFLVVVPVVLAVELSLNAVAHPISGLTSAARYVQAGPIESNLQSLGTGRLLTLGGGEVGRRMEASLRSIVFGIEEAQGYNPVQLRRYWTFTRFVNSERIQHNTAILVDPPPSALDLLQVAWIVAPTGTVADPGWIHLAQSDRRVLYGMDRHPPRASLVTRWTIASPDQSLRLVTAPDFDPGSQAVVEEAPGIPSVPSSSLPGQAVYVPLGPQAGRVDVVAPQPGLVVIRNVYDRHWHATVDGRAVPLLRADYLLQAVAVPAGRHVIGLEYDDPWIGYGLAGSGFVVVLQLGVAAWIARRHRSGSRAYRDNGSSSHR